MIEIYLFMHPLCKRCLAAEKRMLNFFAQENQDIKLHMVPLLNLRSFQQFLELKIMDTKDMKARNELFDVSYSIALDYKSLQLQGKKKARKFLILLQEAVTQNIGNYSQTLVQDSVLAVKGDLDMFYADRYSNTVREAFLDDQIVAKEMGVTDKPAVVVFNYECDRDFGVLIEEHPSNDVLKELLRTDSTSCALHFDTNQDQHHFISKEEFHLYK